MTKFLYLILKSIATAEQRVYPAARLAQRRKNTEDRWGIDSVSLSNYRSILCVYSLIDYQCLIRKEELSPYGLFLTSQHSVGCVFIGLLLFRAKNQNKHKTKLSVAVLDCM